MQLQDLGRLQQIVSVLAKNGLGEFFTKVGWNTPLPAAATEVQSRPLARRLRHALVELGPTWVKLGQVLSVRPDILPPDYIAEFQSLQDTVPPMSADDVRACVEAELGTSIEEVFTDFDYAPIGSASIAQVHSATLHDGRRVAVKVQRRDIEEKIRSDVHILYSLAQLFEGSAIPGMHTPTGIVREFDVAIHNELDFHKELQAADRFGRNFAKNDRIIVPKVYSRWSTRRLLVMELVIGEPISTEFGHTEATEATQALAHLIMECAYDQVFTHGFFHGDPHPGNLLVTHDGKLIVLDFGVTGTLTGSMQDTLISAFTSMVFQDAETLAMTIYRAGGTDERVDLKEFTTEIERLMAKYHGASLEELTENPANFVELIRVATRFHISLPAEFAILSRTFGLIEGSMRALLPGADIIEEVKPYAHRLVTSRLAPDRVALDVARALVQFQGHLKELPTQLTQVLMDLEQGELSFETRDPDASKLRDELRAGVLRLSLALFASVVSLGALFFLAAWSPTPMGIPLFGLMGILLGGIGLSLFGALGIHVIFARYLSLGYWKRVVMGVLRFVSWRRKR